MKMRMRKLVSDDEFANLKNSLLFDIERLKKLRTKADESSEEWFSIMEQKLDKARTASLKFMHGTDDQKRDLLAMFGQEFILENRAVRLTPEPWLTPIRTNYKKLENAYLKLEPEKSKSNSSKKAAIAAIQHSWQG